MSHFLINELFTNYWATQTPTDTHNHHHPLPITTAIIINPLITRNTLGPAILQPGLASFFSALHRPLNLPNWRPVYSIMSSTHLFLYPLSSLTFIVCLELWPKTDEWEIWQYTCRLCFFSLRLLKLQTQWSFKYSNPRKLSRLDSMCII